MRELVGSCIRCKKDVFCTDGFFNGYVLEKHNILCFECKEEDRLVNIMNELLEAEKSGVATLDYLLKTYPQTTNEEEFKHIKEDEAWSCAGLIAAIRREGGTQSKNVGDFVDKVKAQPSLEEKISLLIRGQNWVARKIDEALSFGMDVETKDFLLEMKQRHINNIQSLKG